MMRAMSFLSRPGRLLAALSATLVCLSAIPAQAQELWWNDEGASFASFGPNASVTISLGIAPAGTCGGILPVTNIYVVNTPSVGDGASITDVSNSQGLPNTVFLASGGLFIDETIAFTKPAGELGAGLYSVIFKPCADGKFHTATDVIFPNAFEVVIPVNIPSLPSSSIAALKAQAGDEAASWGHLQTAIEVLEELQEIKEKIECVLDIAGCIVDTAVGWAEDYLKAQAMQALGLVDPIEAAKKTLGDTISHYGGIAADPPDSNFRQQNVLGTMSRINPATDDPLVRAEVGLGNAEVSESAILAALLHSVERYQGASAAKDGEWALVHARAIQALASDLAAQLPKTNAALTGLGDALAADSRDFDGFSTALGPLRAQVAASGFNAEQTRALLNLGLSAAQIAAVRNDVASQPTALFTKSGLQNYISGALATNATLGPVLTTLISDMNVVVSTMAADPIIASTRPVANAGGPYSGTEGAAVSLNGSGSSDPGGSIASYAWDLDGDGQFDDATGATPSVVFPAAFSGFVSLQVTDSDGNVSVDNASVEIAEANHAPTITGFTPTDLQPEVVAGSTLPFSVTAVDPDGDPVSVRWLVDFTQVTTGATFNYTPAAGAIGSHVLRAEAADGNPAGGTVIKEWPVSVLAADLDGDGWRANADCNDANAAVNPGHLEVIGNGIDDDCNAATLDAGTPPVAAFTSSPAIGIVGEAVQFSDSSTDLDSPITTWAWTFGDGGTSAAASPSHTYSSAGTFSVSLTVTDPQTHSSTATNPIVVTHRPSASFTYSPSAAVRNSAVSFSDTSTDADGPITARTWQFGDGATSTAPAPSHAYLAAGPYTVVLDVVDNSGVHATTSQVITVAPAPSDVLSLSFVIAETNCSSGVTYTFKIGSTVAATLHPANDCTCAPGTKTVTVSDPAVLSQISLPVCQLISVSSDKTSYMGWARAEITRPGGVETVKIFDGTTGYANNVCVGAPYGSAGPRTFTSVLSDQDHDNTPDCTDNDIDGDGVLNTADNCPAVVNASQSDFNSNGVGDACEDTDGDTILDAQDNCKAVANTNQRDLDHDGIGDSCDNDIDGDSLANASDNCPYIVNPDQADADSNGHGDLCDVKQVKFRVAKTTCGYQATMKLAINGVEIGSLAPNTDCACGAAPYEVTVSDPAVLAELGAETTCNGFSVTSDYYSYIGWAKAEITRWSGPVESVTIVDKTNGAFNYACSAFEYQGNYRNSTPDTDNDGLWNCKDPDIDNDTVLNAADNCPLVPNTDQADVDGNGLGNACQDTDADGVLDINDNCPVTANANQADQDADHIGDVCDNDKDGDGVPNATDNCPVNANADQANLDHDGLGDACDSDLDNDNVQNTSDNCPTVVNTDQRNTDGDALGDACDADKDNDGVANESDNCPLISNASQAQTNAYGIGDACVPTPITVPWHGSPTQSHQVFSGGKLMLQGIAVYPGYVPAEITSATWDPGDGTAVQNISVANTNALELEHVYTGAPETPYVATLTIKFANNFTRSDTFKVIIKAKTLDVEANMAIDRGLWYLHKTVNRTTVGTGIPAVFWTASSSNVAGSASTVQAFEINNHREVGDNTQDPYVEDVRRGLAWLETQISPMTIGMQAAGDPDTNHNGIGLQQPQNPIYVTGQVADAFVASGTPDGVAVAGDATWVKGRKYKDLVQDMMDSYWWGQADNQWPTTEAGGWRGGWHYSWNSDADNSTAQWGAITGLAGENVWGIPVPAFVKTENLNHWLVFSQTYNGTHTGYDGSFGYGGRSCAWSNCMAETPSGLVQMVFDGVQNDPAATTDPEKRFQEGIRFMARDIRGPGVGGTTNTLKAENNMYGMFAMAKAFRLAKPNPVVMINDDPSQPSRAFDWYRSDPTTGGTGVPTGIARSLIGSQEATGRWSGSSWTESLSTAFSVIILSPTIFQLAPTAVCSATPSTIAAGGSVDFDGTQSYHAAADQSIVSYTWNFQDNTGEASGATTSHTFSSLGTYNVTLTVADGDGITASTTCPVSVIEGNLPPLAKAGGPYDFCVGSPMVLKGSTSTDPDGDPLTYAWDLSNPLNFANPEGTTADFDATSLLASVPLGTYQIGLQVKDDHNHSNAVFPSITIHAANEAPFCHVNVPPTFTPPTDITIKATSKDGAVVTFTAKGNDAEDGEIDAVCAPASGGTFPIGTTTVDCSVTDKDRAKVTGSFNVIVTNNPPTFTPPQDITVMATSKDGAPVSFTAIGHDVEDVDIPAACTPTSGSTFAIGTTRVDCTVTDTRQASVSGSFNVNVLNNPPTFTPPNDITRPATSRFGASVGFAAIGHDLEDGDIAAVCSPASDTTFAIGTTTVLCTVKDSRQGEASGSFHVTVTDNPPTFTPPANITTAATSSSGATVTFTAIGHDVEDGDIPAVCSPESGSTFAITTTTVHCTVTDSKGAPATGSFTVTVTSNAAPVNISGSVYGNHDGYQEKMAINVTVSGSTVQVISGLNYYYTRTRMNLLSTQIDSVVVNGKSATISGVGTLNGAPGYRFVNTVTDGSPDAFGITIYRPDGSLFYSYSQNVVGGGLTIK